MVETLMYPFIINHIVKFTLHCVGYIIVTETTALFSYFVVYNFHNYPMKITRVARNTNINYAVVLHCPKLIKMSEPQPTATF